MKTSTSTCILNYLTTFIVNETNKTATGPIGRPSKLLFALRLVLLGWVLGLLFGWRLVLVFILGLVLGLVKGSGLEILNINEGGTSCN